MKSQFPGYYRPTQAEFKELWNDCIFILDTNVLLNLYRYDEATRNDFLVTLEYVKDRLWIPHQVALEYQENRNQVIKSEEKRLNDIEIVLNGIKNDVSTKLNQFPSVKSNDLLEKLHNLFKNFIDEVRPAMSSQILHSDKHDPVREKLDYLFEDKIGNPPENQQELEKIYSEGEARYKVKCPPGYKDDEKKKESHHLYNQLTFKREFGDLIVWKQILQEISRRSWKHLVFITDDDKEDWWRIEKGQTIGPRPELTKEICDAGISIFYMYSSERFLKYAKEYLEIDIKEESIKQVESIVELEQNQQLLLSSESFGAGKSYAYMNSFLKTLHGSITNVSWQQAEAAVLNWLRYKYPGDLVESSKNFDIGIDLTRLQGVGTDKFGYMIKCFSRGLRPTKSWIINSIQQFYKILELSVDFNKLYLLLVMPSITDVNFFALTRNISRLIEEKDKTNKIHFIIGTVAFLELNDSSQLELIRFEDRIEVSGEIIFIPQYSSDPEIPIVDSI